MFVSFEKTNAPSWDTGKGRESGVGVTPGVHIISAQKTGTHFPSDTFFHTACLPACLPAAHQRPINS